MGSHPALLLLHDGELRELGRVLLGIGIEVHERTGSPAPSERARSWDLVVGTPSRLIELDEGPGHAACRIAALTADTRTARAILARSGVKLVVRLPVHPAALRLLVLHALYRGPERRRLPRAAIGAAVRVRAGLRRRSALLVDLSIRGCRLLASAPLSVGRRIALTLPASVTGGRPLALSASVVRCSGAADGAVSAVVIFQGLSERVARRLAEIVKRHSEGPATCEPDAAVPLADPGAWCAEPAVSAPADEAGAEDEPELEIDEDGDDLELECDDEGPELLLEDALLSDRRAQARRELSDPVEALGLEAARVLIGRDLSTGGMRVDPHPALRLGDELRLALHLGVAPEPLVVRARVARDDGELGLALRFDDLGDAERDELERTLSLLPMVEMPDSGEELGGLVVSEILGRDTADAFASA